MCSQITNKEEGLCCQWCTVVHAVAALCWDTYKFAGVVSISESCSQVLSIALAVNHLIDGAITTSSDDGIYSATSYCFTNVSFGICLLPGHSDIDLVAFFPA